MLDFRCFFGIDFWQNPTLILCFFVAEVIRHCFFKNKHKTFHGAETIGKNKSGIQEQVINIKIDQPRPTLFSSETYFIP